MTTRLWRRFQSGGRFIGILSVALWIGACGGASGGESATDSGGDPGGGTDLQLHCVPGISIQCACIDGSSGAQVCGSDGQGYGPCVCAGSPDDGLEDQGLPADLPDVPEPDHVDDVPDEEEITPPEDVMDVPDEEEITPLEDVMDVSDEEEITPPEDVTDVPDEEEITPPEDVTDVPDEEEITPPEDVTDVPDEEEITVDPCEGKECGDDGTGGFCGQCDPGHACLANQCVCLPDCDGKVCGSDGCGGSCGECGDDKKCKYGKCEWDCGICPADTSCGAPNHPTWCYGITWGCPTGVGSNGACTGKDDNTVIWCYWDGSLADIYAIDCTAVGPQHQCKKNYGTGQYECKCVGECTDKECGGNGCGGSCGTCDGGTVCVDGTCLGEDPFELKLDDGTFESGVGLTADGGMACLVRLSSPVYPVVITALRIYFLNAATSKLDVGDPMKLLVYDSVTLDGDILHGDSLTTNQTAAIGLPAAFTTYPLDEPVTITEGPFAIGFSLAVEVGQVVCAYDDSGSFGAAFLQQWGNDMDDNGVPDEQEDVFGSADALGFPVNFGIRAVTQ